jgi:hypothetical protein
MGDTGLSSSDPVWKPVRISRENTVNTSPEAGTRAISYIISTVL